MLNFILGLIIGGVAVKILCSHLHGNDRLHNPLQSERKEQNLEKVLRLAREKGEVRNDDVQFSLGVSDATATRYLEELEKSGRIAASGTGKGTTYRLK